MATREKKARSVTADSPTPSLGSANSGSNSNISTIAAVTTPNAGTAAVSGGGGGGGGGGSGDVSGGSNSAPTTPTSSRKGVAAATSGVSTNINSGHSVSISGGGGLAAGSVSGGSGGSSSSSTTRASLSRLKSKQLLLNDESSADDTVAISGSEGSSSATTTPSRTTRRGGSIPREDSVGAEDKEDMTLCAAGISKDRTKSPAIGARRAAAVAAAAVVSAANKAVPPVATATIKQTSSSANNRKHRVVSLKRTSLLKRKGKKIIGKPILGKKVVARRQLAAAVTAAAATGKTSSVRGLAATVMPIKKEVTTTSPTATTAKEEEVLSTPSLRNGKPRNSDSPVAKRKSVGSAALTALKQEINKSPEQIAAAAAQIKIERRRSCSVSKFSDDGETPGGGFEFKRELLDYESRSKMLDKMAEAFNEPMSSKDEKASSSSGGTLRRSMRQRKSTTRDKEDFVTPRVKGASMEIKVEQGESAESVETGEGETDATPQTAPLTIDTTEVVPVKEHHLGSDEAASATDASVSAAGVGEELVEKDPSLSPELISEGVSELSVKECYSEPAFLENNLGIEKDPKLGEIVQGRFRCDKVSDDSGGACDNGQDDEEEKEEGKMSASGGGEEHVQEQESVSTEEEEVPTASVTVVDSGVEIANGAQEELAKEKDKEELQEGEEKEQKVQVRTVSEDDDQMLVEEDQPSDQLVEETIGGDDALEESVVNSKELDKVDETESKAEDDAMEEDEVEVLVELESGKADSDSETTSVVAAMVETTAAKQNDEAAEDEEEEEEDVTVVEETADEEVLTVETPPPSSTAHEWTDTTTTVVEIVVEDDCEEKSLKEDDKPDDGEETGEAAEAIVTLAVGHKNGTTLAVASIPDSSLGGGLNSASENNGMVKCEREQQTSKNQQTSRAAKANPAAAVAGTSSAATTATTTKAKSTSGGGAGAVSGSGNSGGKETKSKSRTGKEKGKDDEKTREEKLRQEKLRVEEKVREEKLRAEMRLKAEQKKEGTKVLGNGVADEVSTIGSESSPSSPGEKPIGDVAEKELKTDPAVVTLISLGGLNLPAITIVKKESSNNTAAGTRAALATTIKKELKEEEEGTEINQKPKAELEILPIAVDGASILNSSLQSAVVVLTSKEHKPAKEAGGGSVPSSSVASVESPLQIISKSENAAAAVTIAPSKPVDGVDEGNKSPVASSLSIIENCNNSNGASGGTDGNGDASSKHGVTELSVGDKRANLVAQLPDDKAATTTGPAVGKEKPQSAAPLLFDESDDVAKQKESHLKHLGLLTIRAACEEKQRRAEQKPSTSSSASNDLLQDGDGAAGSSGGDGWLAAAISQSHSGNNGAGGSAGGGGGRNGNKSTRGSRDEYTVSMKSVLKGGSSGSGRGEKRKQQRMPLKMTFQKGKGKGSSGNASGDGGMTGRGDSSNGSGTSSNGSAAGSASGYATDAGNNGDNTPFYTIHSNELDHHSSNSSDGHSQRDSSTGGRKTHSRSHTTDGVAVADAVGESIATDKAVQKSLVIPEKASSFNVHPERLCQDQCFYCGGKFGLYDTPCHIAAIKSSERQQKILLAESKITLDSCLCDACFRHVDRKANYPSQKKKSSSTGSQQSSTGSSSSGAHTGTTGSTTQSTVSPIVIKMTTNKDGSTSIAGQHHQPMVIDDGNSGAGGKAREICAVRQCTSSAMQSLRRKWVLKMKRKIGKQLDINLEQAARATTENISICNRHYEQISHLMICAMCTRPLQRNHVYHMYNNIPQLEHLIQEQGLSIRLSSSELVVCKLCRHYANLLFKPPDPKSQKAQFIKNYNRRLYNLRHRATQEQDEQDPEVQSVDTSISPNDASRCHSLVEVVISDGDDDGDEDNEVEEYPAPQQQSQQYHTVGDLFSIGDNSVSLRRRGSTRKSPDVSIIENSSVAQMSDRLGEITIIPTTKTFTSTNHHNQHHSQSSSSSSSQQRDDNFDMTKVLKSNPNISMRELFPGEEELGVHVNIPFSSSTMRTPEGWTKVTSTIQYDDNTRALWEELQKPYGNQSSFLRHLVLLEQYFRNGDLVLSPQAKTNATTYSEAVQNRLRSFDNVPTPSSPPALASLTPATTTIQPAAGPLDKTSHIFQQFSSATITIVPATKARSKAPSSQATISGSAASSSSNNASESSPAQSTAPVSLLKSNNLRLSVSGSYNSEKVTGNSLKRKLSNEGKAAAMSGASITVASSTAGSSGGGTVGKVAKLDEPKAPSSIPPELISIHRRSSIPVTTIPTSCSTAHTASAAVASQPKQQSLLQSAQSLAPQQTVQAPTKRSPPASVASTSAAGTGAASATNTTVNERDVIHMPEQLTETEREETAAKPWRPTLLPIAPGTTESLKYGPLYQTADGRLLPMLVQVMSGGKPYHISIDDYNRMCIMRREKLIQQQHNMTQSTAAGTVAAKRAALQQQRPAATSTATTASAVSAAPSSLRLSVSAVESTLGNSGAATTITAHAAGSGSGTRLVQIPNQILEQNSLIPIAGGSSIGGSSSRFGGSGVNFNAQKNSSLTVTMTTSINNNNNNFAKTAATVNTATPVKPLSLPNSTTVYPMMISANTITLPSASSSSGGGGGGAGGGGVGLMFSQASSIGRPGGGGTSLVLTQQQPSLINTHCNMVSASSNPLDQLLKGGKHVTQSQLQAFAAASSPANGGAVNSLLDSPAQLLSKIPKSLTVIPQQRQRVSSHEDQHSA